MGSPATGQVNGKHLDPTTRALTAPGSPRGAQMDTSELHISPAGAGCETRQNARWSALGPRGGTGLKQRAACTPNGATEERATASASASSSFTTCAGGAAGRDRAAASPAAAADAASTSAANPSAAAANRGLGDVFMP